MDLRHSAAFLQNNSILWKFVYEKSITVIYNAKPPQSMQNAPIRGGFMFVCG